MKLTPIFHRAFHSAPGQSLTLIIAVTGNASCSSSSVLSCSSSAYKIHQFAYMILYVIMLLTPSGTSNSASKSVFKKFFCSFLQLQCI